MARWRMKAHSQVKTKLRCEADELRDFLPTRPDEFAIHRRPAAYLAINRRIFKHLTWWPKAFAYRDKTCGDEVLFTDVSGWRLIIKIDYNDKIVHALYLDRIESRQDTPFNTFQKWKSTLAKNN